MQTNNSQKWLDAFLHDIAEKVQLSPTLYQKAQEHYRAVTTWVSDANSGISAYKPYIYPHGSFRTRSTTAANTDSDDFDIDCMLELKISPGAPPEDVLEAVYNSIDRGPGTRYHGRVELKRRCVRVQYEDMHLDLTPSVLVSDANPRESFIFDTHPDRPDHAIANPEGFARWFERNILPIEILNNRFAMDESIAKALPVPDQQPLEKKPVKLVALQLIKRFRDVCYTDDPWEKPPSVLVSYLVAAAPLPEATLIETLHASVRYLIVQLSRGLISVPNPSSKADMLTDRWPGTPQRQNRFVEHMEDLDIALGKLQQDTDLKQQREILKALFGETVTSRSFDDITKRYAESASRGTLRAVTGAAAIIPPTSHESQYGTAIRQHTNFGDDLE